MYGWAFFLCYHWKTQEHNWNMWHQNSALTKEVIVELQKQS